jgi:cyanophycinase-like exopeptidase
MPARPGVIALVGSGETASNGGRTFEAIAGRYSSPLRVAILETPAGFELNSERVAGRIAEFVARRLQNYAPEIAVIPARRRGDACGPDNPEILAPLATADIIFMGPGSPTYAIRQLGGTLAWQAVLARHGEGASLILASAAAIAVSHMALPVYEIYKAGDDLGWRDGLDLLGHYGLRLAIVPHWNNAEGGSELDTSRCFMGQARFGALAAMLPAGTGILGIDEHTTLLIDPKQKHCSVIGRGEVKTVHEGVERSYAAGSAFPATALGSWREADLPQMPGALQALQHDEMHVESGPPQEVLELAERREDARQRKDWPRADALRAEIEALGWEVRDTPAGPEIVAR